MRWAVLIAALFMPTVVSAAEYPVRAVRIVVPYPVGGAVDLMARYLGSTIKIKNVIENKPGAGGLLAAREVSLAQPDGYTLLMGNVSPNGIDPAWFYTPKGDSKLEFDCIAYVAGFPLVLVARPNMTKEEVLKQLKAGGTYATYGVGGTSHMAMFALAPKGVNVPYRGGPAMVAAVVSGEVVASFIPGPVVLPWIRNGSVQALMSTQYQPLKPYDKIPTLRQNGHDFYLSAWSGLMAPKGTPTHLLDRWHSAVQEALNDLTWYEQNGFVARKMSRKEFDDFVKSEKVKYQKIADKIVDKMHQ